MGLPVAEDFIKGYRPRADRPRERSLSYDYMLQTPKASKLLNILWTSKDKNCEGREEEFSGDDLPTDREAQLMCAGCPLKKTCGEYAREAHPAWGVWEGTVRGRNLQAAMKEDEDGERP